MKKLLFVVTAVITGSQLFSQDGSTTKSLDEVIVTANKTPQKQSSTGKVISVITKEQLDKSTGKTVGQILNEQAGLVINGSLNNAGTNQSVYMRGAASGRTLILVDGVPVYDPSLINNEFDLNLLSLNNIERIEICRGAQSTLYGSEAVAGVINIITTPSSISKPFNVKATLGYGNKSTFRGNVQLFGKEKKLTYNARYARFSTNGFSAAYDATGTGNFDKDHYKSDVASVAVQYQLSDALSARTFFTYSRFNSDIDASAFTDEKDWVNNSRNIMAGAAFNFQKNNVTLHATYQYSDITRHSINDSLDQPGFTIYSKDDYFGKSQFIEGYANIALGSGFNLLQGADYRFNGMNNHFISISSFGPFVPDPIDSVQSQGSLYGSLYYHTPDEKLNIELGGRLNVHSRYGSNSTYTFNPSYNIDKHFRLFGSVATGFKAPSVYQLYSSYGDPNLKPETSTNYELGVQQQHEKFQNRIVYFHRIIKNGIDFNNVIFQYFNFNKQTVNGIEFESSFDPIKNLHVSLNYTYLDPQEKSQSRKTFNDTAYNYLLKRAKNNINFTAGYTINDFYISASLKYVDKRFDAGGYMADDVEMDSYLLVGAYTEYKLKKFVKLFADFQNITNKKFFDVRGYNSIPFMVNGGVTFTW
jgi:vitamin B12 transporter